MHLKVSDLDRAVSFYRDGLGMTVKHRIDGAAFLAFGRYHHHLALNTWHSAGGGPAPDGAVGLYHFAVRYATRRELALAVRRLLAIGSIESTSDCGGIADSIYTRDPDGNGVELTWDRPPELRPDPLPADDAPLDLEALLAEVS